VGESEVVVKSSQLTAPVVIVAVVAAVGCNAVKPGREPAQTFEAAKRAILEENYEGLWRLVSSRARDAEAARIRAEQRQVEDKIGDLTEDDRLAFQKKHGVLPDEFMNLTPAGAFANRVRNTARLGDKLSEALLDAHVIAADVNGDAATLAVEIPGEKPAKLAMVREQGLWVIPSMMDFFASIRLSGRIRKAGDTPQETYNALLACVSAGAFEDVWDLFDVGLQGKLADTFLRSIDEVKKLDDDQRRQLEQTYGVDVETYVKMGPRELLALNLRIQFRDPGRREAIMLRQVRGVAVVDGTDMAVLTLSGSGDKSKVKLKRDNSRGGKWYLLDVDF
jgi:hypothetical protein